MRRDGFEREGVVAGLSDRAFHNPWRTRFVAVTYVRTISAVAYPGERLPIARVSRPNPYHPSLQLRSVRRSEEITINPRAFHVNRSCRNSSLLHPRRFRKYPSGGIPPLPRLSYSLLEGCHGSVRQQGPVADSPYSEPFPRTGSHRDRPRQFRRIALMNPTDSRYTPSTAAYLNEAFPFLRRTARGRCVVPNGLVVTPDYDMRGNLGEALLLSGVAPIFAASIADAAYHLATSSINFVVCEHHLSDGPYTELLSIARASVSPPPLIVVSSTGDWPDYFEAIDRGAYDFLAYPLIPGELQRILSAYLRLNFDASP